MNRIPLHVFDFIKEARVISFDLWDTLVRRKCHPDETKLRLCRYVWLTSVCSIRQGEATPSAIFWMRKSIEDRIANEDWEYRFCDVARALIDEINSTYSTRSELTVEILEEAELQIENSSTHIDKQAYDLLKQACDESSKAERMILLISDFYHSSLWLSRFLSLKGISQYFEYIHSSSDNYLTKRSGLIYEDLIRKNTDWTNSWIHIGDNRVADHETPKKYNIHTYLYESELHITNRRRWGTAFIDHSKSRDPQIHTSRIAKLLQHASPAEYESKPSALDSDIGLSKAADLFKSGQKIAGIFIGFITRIIEDALSIGAKDIFFFSREGIFFRELYDLLVDIDVYDLGDKYPNSHVLRVSRAATFAASLKNGSIDELMRMWSLYSHQSPQAFGRSLNLDRLVIEQACEKYQLLYEDAIRYPWESKRFQELLADPEVSQHIEERIRQQRRQLTAYLSNQMLGTNGTSSHIHIVDIGWRGTIQDNLAHLLSPAKIHGTYLALDKFLNTQHNDCSKTGYLFDNNTSGSDHAFGDVAILEFLSNVPGGTVLGYLDNGTPILHEVAGEERVIVAEGTIIQEGIKSGTKSAASYIKNHGLTSTDLKKLARNTWHDLQENPPSCIADAFNRLHHNETFGTGKASQILDLDYRLFESASLTPAEIHNTFNELWRQSRWKESLLKSTGLSQFVSTRSRIDLLSLPSEIFTATYGTLSGIKAIIFMPPPIKGSGGHRTILNLAKGLIRAGCQIDLQLEEFNEAVSYIHDEMTGYRFNLTQWWQPGSTCNIAIATVGHSPEFVAKEVNADFKYYLVQDYEAEFNPMSDGYVNVENSYAYGLIPLCIGSWLPHFLNEKYDLESFYSGLGADTSIYFPKDDAEREKMIAFLYQPEKCRRLSQYCLQALKEVQKADPSIRVVSYGSDAAPPLEGNCEHLGLVKDLERLSNLYSSATVGLCISLTNPSRIPFEMMACGCVPVDVYRYNNMFDYVNRTAILAYQNPGSIAQAILHLFETPKEWSDRSQKCIHYAKPRTMKWEVDTLVNSITAVTNDHLHERMPKPIASYTDEPILALVGSTDSHAKKFCAWQFTQASS